MTLRRFWAARIAVTTIFALNGVVFASWALHIPTVKNHLGLDDGVLGASLLAGAVGSTGIMPFIGGLIARWGSRRVMLLAAFGMEATVVALLFSPSLALLLPLLFLSGMSNGALDVSMNAQAVEIEQGFKRPIMSSFHAGFSLGALAGAALGGLLLKLGWSPQQHVIAIASTALIITLVVARWFLPSSAAPHDGPAFVLPRGPLVALGVLALLDLIAEGAMFDWSAVYMRDWLGTSAEYAAWGLSAFSLLMTGGRIIGDWLQQRLGGPRMVRWSALLSSVGLALALIANSPLAAIIGFGCVGFGLANIIPVLFSTSGNLPNIPAGTGIAAVTTTGYFGFFIGPPLIGFTAKATSLPIALGVVAACIGVVALWGPYVLQHSRHPHAPQPIDSPAKS